jgi:hypothetical protein
MSKIDKIGMADIPQEMSQNFYWGECVNNVDPLMLGRVRVRPLIKNIDEILTEMGKPKLISCDNEFDTKEFTKY